MACGPGGVGKTTTAAASALMAAVNHGSKVLVLTVDPAKRLANALGLDGIGNTEHRVPADAFAAAGVKPRGELWAAMLDTKESWDSLIRQHAPDEQTRDEILANPLYQNIAGRFVQSHDYIAMERLYEIHSTGEYDLIVVDTPPTRNALDFLDAPERLADFFSSRLLRWLIVPYRSKLINVATKPFYQISDRILGTEFMGDISEFFILFQTMYDGFVERSKAVGRLLSDRRTTFVVVSTLEATPLREAEFFAEQLTERKLHLGAIVLNKVLPDYLQGPGRRRVAEAMKDRAEELACELAPALGAADPALGDPAQIARVLTEVADSFLNFQVVALREGEERAEPGRGPRGAGHRAVLRHRHLRPGRACCASASRSGPRRPDTGRPGGALRCGGDRHRRSGPRGATPPSTPRPRRPTSRTWPPSSAATLQSPGMMVGRLEGRYLELLVFALSATSVLEIGTFSGYSALAMAAGLAPGRAHRHVRALARCTPRSPAATSPPAPTPTGSRSWRARPSRPSPDSGRSVRPGLHRRRQGQLPRLLRGGAAQAGAPGRDRRRQHPVVGPHPRPVGHHRWTPWPCGRSTTSWPPTPGWWPSRRPSATASP